MDSDAVEAPTALPGLQRYPALIIGFLIAAFNAYITIKGAGGLDDGFQWNPDGWAILVPALGAIGIHTQVFSQETVDRLAPRSKQHEVVKAKHRR